MNLKSDFFPWDKFLSYVVSSKKKFLEHPVLCGVASLIVVVTIIVAANKSFGKNEFADSETTGTAVFDENAELGAASEPEDQEENDLADWGQSSSRAAGTVKKLMVGDVEYRFRWIPAGTFNMGSPQSEKNRDDDEILHEVELTHGYWMLETEVTQRMYESVMKTNPSAFSENGSRSVEVEDPSTDDLPVESVSRIDCHKFITVLREMTNIKFRLPTEAEWEYACRAGSNSLYSGSNDLDKVGWYWKNSENRTHKVKSKKPNAWGLYDMSGNVYEWCLDLYQEYSDKNTHDQFYYTFLGTRLNTPDDIVGEDDILVGGVIRGGSFQCEAWKCRSAHRHADVGRFYNCGFRFVFVPPNEQELKAIAKKKAAEKAAQEEAKKQAEKEAAEKDAADSAAKEVNKNAAKEIKEASKANSSGQSSSIKAGTVKTLTINGVEYRFHWIPAGKFMMGAREKETSKMGRNSYSYSDAVFEDVLHDDNDFIRDLFAYSDAVFADVLHEVELTRGYWLLETETTQKMWTSVMGDESSNNSEESGGKTADNQPATYKNWDDSQNFLTKLSSLAKDQLPKGFAFRFRLPTEAEWEYACRADEDYIYSGSDDLDEVGWYEDNSDGKTHEVAQKQPNAWGLYDMSGNVQEWCQDLYKKDAYYGSTTDPQGPRDESNRAESEGDNKSEHPERVVRGGCYSSSERSCICATRSMRDQVDSYNSSQRANYEFIGFRFVLEPLDEEEIANIKADKQAETVEWIKSTSNEAGTLKKLTINDVDYRFHWIPEGKFMMGSPDTGGWHDEDEKQHEVKLTRGYWMLETEATQRMWLSVMKKLPGDYGYSPEEKPAYPIAHVSWNDCQKFFTKLRDLAKEQLPSDVDLRFRLPTEAEWEYACRAGEKYQYSGSNSTYDVAWIHAARGSYGGNYDSNYHPVAQKKANAWGLYDMSGNVCEWCQDWYGAYSGSTTDPEGPQEGSKRVFRGGSAHEYDYDQDCRCANRDSLEPEKEYESIGFRFILEPAM